MSKFTSISKIVVAGVFTFLFVALLSSCSRKINFATSTVVPGAEGKVIVKQDDNKNYAVEVNVTNLAGPDRLTPPRNVYVVWMETEDRVTKNIGQLKSSSGLFSSTLKGSLNTVSATKPVRVYITAEDTPSVTYPGSQVVITTPNF